MQYCMAKLFESKKNEIIWTFHPKTPKNLAERSSDTSPGNPRQMVPMGSNGSQRFPTVDRSRIVCKSWRSMRTRMEKRAKIDDRQKSFIMPQLHAEFCGRPKGWWWILSLLIHFFLIFWIKSDRIHHWWHPKKWISITGRYIRIPLGPCQQFVGVLERRQIRGENVPLNGFRDVGEWLQGCRWMASGM